MSLDFLEQIPVFLALFGRALIVLMLSSQVFTPYRDTKMYNLEISVISFRKVIKVRGFQFNLKNTNSCFSQTFV